jgi:transcriptional regulator with XRE-family HTH domain
MGTMKFYRSYNFKDKDPVIDILRTRLQELGWTYGDLSEVSDVSATTLWNWFEGKTRRPQHATIMAVANAMGARGHGFNWGPVAK